MKINIPPLAGLLALLCGFVLSAVSARATVYQAENATLSQAAFENTNAGYNGTGYVNYVNVAGSYVQFNVNAAAAGSHTLVFRYAFTGTDRPMQIKVNGAVAVASLNFVSTGAFTTWATQSTTVTLTAGANTIRATANVANGGPNLDQLDVTVAGGGAAPVFTTHPSPAAQTVNAGANVSYTVAASGSPTPTYQWRKDGVNLAGATAATLALNNVSAANAGVYTAVATNSAGSATSNSATLNVNSGGTPNFSQVGWSTLNGGTTGGSASTVVNVNTVAALQAAAGSTTSQTIRITAPLTSNGAGTKIVIKSNKTILGDGANGVLQGIAFSILGNTSNIIIRNLKMSLTNIADPLTLNNGDCIQLYGATGPIRNVWIDHCEFYAEPIQSQPYSNKYDGLVDLTRDVAFVTISWCHFRDHWKSNLVGNSDTDNFNRRATYHHNRYDNVFRRCPFYSFGQGHVYNSYFEEVGLLTFSHEEGNAYGFGVRIARGAVLKVEGNVFENCHNPVRLDPGQGHVIVSPGNLANQYIGCTGNQPTSSTPGAPAFTIPYAYTPEPTSTVKNTVLTWAGFGKIDP